MNESRFAGCWPLDAFPVGQSLEKVFSGIDESDVVVVGIVVDVMGELGGAGTSLASFDLVVDVSVEVVIAIFSVKVFDISVVAIVPLVIPVVVVVVIDVAVDFVIVNLVGIPVSLPLVVVVASFSLQSLEF